MVNDDSASKILNKLDDISREIKVLRNDVSKTKTDMSIINLRVQTVADGSKAIEVDIGDIKSDLRRLEVLHEETDSVIQQIAESVSPVFEHATELQIVTTKHGDELDEHNRRLKFLEKAA